MNTAFATFQDALYAALNAPSAVTLAPVTLGWPKDGLASKQVWIAGKGSVDMSDELSGFSQRDETITTEIRVKADVTDSRYSAARDAAFALVAEVEDAINADRTLGGAVTYAHVTSLSVEEAIPDQTVRSVGVVLTVTADVTVTG